MSGSPVRLKHPIAIGSSLLAHLSACSADVLALPGRNDLRRAPAVVLCVGRTVSALGCCRDGEPARRDLEHRRRPSGGTDQVDLDAVVARVRALGGGPLAVQEVDRELAAAAAPTGRGDRLLETSQRSLD